MDSIQTPSPFAAQKERGSGWDAFRRNWRPFLLIQGCALAIVLLYWQSPAVQAASASLVELKARGGLLFTALGMILASIVLPEAARRLTGRASGVRSAGDLVFQIGFFAGVGIVVDLFYRLQAGLFGGSPSVAVVAAKMLVDQFVFTPLATAPVGTGLFLWRDARFDLGATRRAFSGGGFQHRYWLMLTTCWGYWVPVLAAVYAMPPGLQFWLFLFAQAAWTLLLLQIGEGDDG